MKFNYTAKSLQALCLTILALSSAAIDAKGISYDLEGDTYIAEINGKKIPASSAQIMRSAINRGKQQISMPEFMQGAIENQLLADYGTKTVGIEKMLPSGNVGFNLDVALEDQFINVIRLTYEAPLQKYINQHFKHGNLLSAATKPFKMTRKELKPHTVMKNQRELGLTDEQIENAKTIELMRYQFPGQETDHPITLWDIYKRQNVQGKDIMHKADLRYIKTQLQQRIGSLMILNWIDKESGLNQEEIQAIKDFVFAKHFKKLYIAQQGLVRVLHKDNPRLTEMAKTITQEEITDYYKKNKEDFKQTDRAKGRKIRSQDYEKMQQAYKDIEAGKDFNEVAKQYSDAKTKDGKVDIETGWLSRKEKDNHWLRTLLFLQPISEASRPYRSPQSNAKDPVFFQIIITDEKEESYQAHDSEGVRYQVSRILAEKKMIREFAKLRKQLLKEADVKINGSLLKKLAAKK